MKKAKKNQNNVILFSLLAILTITFVLLVIRYCTTSESSLTCTKDLTDQYNEELSFRFDIYDKLYSYNRVEYLHDLSEDTYNENITYFMNEYNKIKEELNDNFKYSVENKDNNITITTYITVSAYPNFFNQYINNEHITSNTRLTDIKNFLESNDYKCNVTRK